MTNQLSEQHKVAFKIDFITRSFREVADKDYLAARICYRYDLELQFLWFALQAIEKYLKAILLYNAYSAKGLSHNIYGAYQRVLQISDIKFDFPEDVEKFIKFLDDYGANRYFEFPHYLRGEDCLILDKTVWYIRKWCKYIRGTVTIKGKEIERLPFEIKEIKNKLYEKNPNRYRIFNGYLERVLKDKKSEIREQLIWKNFYFGTYAKKTIKNYKSRISWSNPTHFMHEAIYPELKKMVDFSKPVRDYFERKTNC